VQIFCTIKTKGKRPKLTISIIFHNYLCYTYFFYTLLQQQTATFYNILTIFWLGTLTTNISYRNTCFVLLYCWIIAILAAITCLRIKLVT
jgi:hypothetical protein